MNRFLSFSRPVLFLLPLIFLWVGCEGPVGPPGPPGNAQVYTVNLRFSLTDDDVAFTDYVANLSYTMPEITPAVVDEGAVLVYLRDQENTWLALPFTVGVEAGDPPRVDYTYTLGYAFRDGRLDLFVDASSADDVVWDEIMATTLLAQERDVKVVILETFPASKAGIDLRNYEAVKAYYGLRD